MKYKGVIVEESLKDNRILNDLEIIKFEITKDEDPKDRWHIYTVLIPGEDIENLSKFIESNKWYMHFWNENNITVIFKDKKFQFNVNDKIGRESAIQYGLSIGIPKEQLDFVIN